MIVRRHTVRAHPRQSRGGVTLVRNHTRGGDPYRSAPDLSSTDFVADTTRILRTGWKLPSSDIDNTIARCVANGDLARWQHAGLTPREAAERIRFGNIDLTAPTSR